MTEQEIFLARFDAANKSGLVDIKFFVHDGGNLSAESFFQDANDFAAAIENGNVEEFAGLGADSKRFDANNLWY